MSYGPQGAANASFLGLQKQLQLGLRMEMDNVHGTEEPIQAQFRKKNKNKTGSISIITSCLQKVISTVWNALLQLVNLKRILLSFQRTSPRQLPVLPRHYN